MAGGTLAHSTISSNILGELYNQLRGTDCTVRNRDTRIRSSPTGLYSYVDAVVSCADEQAENDTLLNPVMIVEVLWESTKDYNRGMKFQQYRQISCFCEYIGVAQDHPPLSTIRHDVDPKIWTTREYTSLR